MSIEPDISSIEEVLGDFRQGKMVIMVDDQNRENEGDLLIAAECVTADHINFMASHGRGLICLAMTEERCMQLQLPLMVSRNNARFATNFTVSIEAARGVTTGISAQDRAATIQAAVHVNAQPDDLVTPGHIFPIKAQPGGVLTRAGHTEAGVDMAKICGFEPAGVICEILNRDGTMARLPDLVKYAREYGYKVGTIADLIHYRMQNDPTLQRVNEKYIQLAQGTFRAFLYRDTVEGGTHLALVKGEITPDQPVPTRVYVHRGLLDVVMHPHSQSSWTLDRALTTIAQLSMGVVLILSYNESVAEIVQRMGQSSDGALRKALADDSHAPQNLRMLGAGGQILSDLGIRKILALGREKRTHGLSGFGLEVVGYVDSPERLHEWLAR